MNRKKVLGTFQIAMINIIAVDSIRTLPFSAEYGFSLIFFYLLAAIFFFIPSALVSAELGTGWPNTGGIYIWVREAFGKKASLITIWLNWIYNIAWYPTIMALIAGTITYFFRPELAQNKLYMSLAILILYWAATLWNFLGMQASSFLSTCGALIGTIFPMVLIAILGFIWVVNGRPLEVPLNFFPDFSQWNNIAFMSTVLFGLLGLEMAATHAVEMRDPKKDYPRAVFYAVIVILLTIILASLAIAFVVPHKQLSLVTGTLQAFSVFFKEFHIAWMLPVIASCIILGGLSAVGAWIIGPTKGLMVAARDGSLPPFLKKMNKKGVPINILLLQAILVSILCLIFILMPTVNSSFWVLSNITAQLALIVYIFLFASGIRLRYKAHDVSRSFSIPGGKRFGMWVVGCMGIFSCVLAIVLGFFPPEQITLEDTGAYEVLLVSGIAFLFVIPMVFYYFNRKRMDV